MGFPFDRHWVWLLGFYLSSALFNLVLYAFLRDRIHLWYIAYVVCVTVFLMMEDGLDAMLFPAWLYKLIWSVGQYNFMILAAAAGIPIMRLFLRLRASWPRLNRAGTWLAWAAVLFVATYAVLYPWAVRHSLSLVDVLNGARELMMLLVFGYGWTTLLGVLLTRRQRRIAAMYAVTYFFFFTGYAVFWLNHLGLTSFNPIYPNALAWGLLLELLFLSALLTGRFRHTLRQIAQLRIRQLRQRNAQSARLIAAQEDEREQLARELHDALGPNLMALHLAWQGPAVRQALETSPDAAAAGRQAELLLRHLRDEVRTFSHALLPAEPGLGTLSESIQALGDLINLYGSPVVHTYCDQSADQLPPALRQAAYRIAAELLNNAVRHSRATEVHVQVLRHPDTLQARADYLRGRVHIDSTDQGTSIVVQIPC
jgi:signal transduction histidine kinase